MPARFRKKPTVRRSQLEDRIEADLVSRGINFGYETLELTYAKEPCPHCGKPVAVGKYTPDFIIERGLGLRRLVIEGKGYLNSQERVKMIRVKRDNPDEDIRFLFLRDEKIAKKSATRYSKWCGQHGYPFAIGHVVPQEWLDEGVTHAL